MTMAGTKEIKARIESVQETRKITNAMYLIASTKLRRARQELNNTRPYFEALKGEIKRIFRMVADVDSRYFYPDSGEPPLTGTYGCLVITADKGLAGAYNQNAIRQALQLLEQHPDTKLFVVGEYGRRFFDRQGVPIEHSFLYTAQNPTMARAREISARLLEGYDKGELQKIFVVYTDMEKGSVYEANATRILPFHRAFFSSTGEESAQAGGGPHFEFVPNARAVLDNIVPIYVSGFIYSALIDSFCCEQSARMTAMDSADRNAEKLLSEFSLRYNRVRQAAITQEITEVSAGAKAQRQKHKKER